VTLNGGTHIYNRHGTAVEINKMYVYLNFITVVGYVEACSVDERVTLEAVVAKRAEIARKQQKLKDDEYYNQMMKLIDLVE